MTISSWPFVGAAATDETKWSRLFRELQDTGVAGSADGTDLKVTANGSGMSVFVAAGLAIVRGHAMYSDGSVTKTIDAAHATLERIDRIVARLDPTANSITIEVVKGTAGSGLPALTQTDTGTYEMPLAQVTVSASVTNIAAGKVTDDRPFQGTRVRAWLTAKRPSNPRLSQLGYNLTTNSWEFWNGSAWTALTSAVAWADITGKPSTFPPEAHTQDWTTITGKPSLFAPSGHTHDWADIGPNVPATFPPSTHSHSWASITSKPSTFPVEAHNHSPASLVSMGSATVGYANGSQRVAGHSVSGGPFYAVWVDGDDLFGKNTSSERYKENIRDYAVDPDAVLALQPRVYDRRDTVDEDGETKVGNKDEYGLIAEEVNELLPELVVRDKDGQIDALRYDLLAVALLDVVKRQQAQIDGLHEIVEGLMAG